MNRSYLIMCSALLLIVGCASDGVQYNPDADDAPSFVEADYYTAPLRYIVDMELSCDNDFSTDDSATLQSAIDYVSSNGGGRITIPEGNYSFANIELKSNVYMQFSAGVTIRPFEIAEYYDRNYTIFDGVTESATPISNVAFVGVGGDFTIDLRYVNEGFERLRCFLLGNMKNFKFANMRVEDCNSRFAAIDLIGENVDGVIYLPNHASFSNLKNYNSEYGYGLIQIQGGQTMLFDNLYSKGGVALRMESHLGTYYGTDCIDYIADIVGRDITCEYGHAAVMLSPHFVNNGRVDVWGIRSNCCESALQCEAGYANESELELGLGAGSFSPESTFRNIDATASVEDCSAQIHPKHFSCMASEREYLLPSSDPYEAKEGPSIAVVLQTGYYPIDCDEDDIVNAEDFLPSQLMVYGEWDI